MDEDLWSLGSWGVPLPRTGLQPNQNQRWEFLGQKNICFWLIGMEILWKGASFWNGHFHQLYSIVTFCFKDLGLSWFLLSWLVVAMTLWSPLKKLILDKLMLHFHDSERKQHFRCTWLETPNQNTHTQIHQPVQPLLAISPVQPLATNGPTLL